MSTKPQERNEENSLAPSKTQRKKAMEALQNLGEALLLESIDFLKKLPVSDELHSAFLEAKKMIRQDTARKRQLQYIGKLMRNEASAPLEEALAKARGQSASENARFHRLEALRDRFLEDERVLEEICAHDAGVDTQHLRALRRAALREKEANKPPHNYRALFQELKRFAHDANE